MRRASLLLALPLAACGSGEAPTQPTLPGVHDVSVVVFADDDGDGRLGASETARVPGVLVELGGRRARSEIGTGLARLEGVPSGSWSLAAVGGLPPYHTASARSVAVPPPGELALPLRLPIGDNRPHVYMAFGDSITVGIRSSDGGGYRDALEAALRAHYGTASLVDEGFSGSRTAAGVERLPASLARVRPAWTLVLYGTNDWSRLDCQQAPPCDVAQNLRRMVATARAASSLPVVATLPPVNPANNPGLAARRNAWVEVVNDSIRAMAAAERVPLADVGQAFAAAGDPSLLLADSVHPNDRGYALVTRAFFEALTTPQADAATAEVGHAGGTALGAASRAIEPPRPGAVSPVAATSPRSAYHHDR